MDKMSSGKQTKVTIDDVARAAGVSIKTVSRVANGEPNVSNATRERVQNVIAALDYQANPFARYLGTLGRKEPARRSSATDA